MQTVTISQIAERLEELPIDKLVVVYDFVLYLTERGSDLPQVEIVSSQVEDTQTQNKSDMKQKLAAAAEAVREDYLTDDELTSFTA